MEAAFMSVLFSPDVYWSFRATCSCFNEFVTTGDFSSKSEARTGAFMVLPYDYLTLSDLFLCFFFSPESFLLLLSACIIWLLSPFLLAASFSSVAYKFIWEFLMTSVVVDLLFFFRRIGPFCCLDSSFGFYAAIYPETTSSTAILLIDAYCILNLLF